VGIHDLVNKHLLTFNIRLLSYIVVLNTVFMNVMLNIKSRKKIQ